MCQKCTVLELPTEGLTRPSNKAYNIYAFSCAFKHQRALFMNYRDPLEGAPPISEGLRGDGGGGGVGIFTPSPNPRKWVLHPQGGSL